MAGGTVLLGDITTLTGGTLVSSAAEVKGAGSGIGSVTRIREWWGWFAIAALVLFVGDLALRLSLAPARGKNRASRPSRMATQLRRPTRRAPPRRPPPSLR